MDNTISSVVAATIHKLQFNQVTQLEYDALLSVLEGYRSSNLIPGDSNWRDRLQEQTGTLVAGESLRPEPFNIYISDCTINL